MAYVCEYHVNNVCQKYVEHHDVWSDLAMTRQDANWLIVEIVGFWLVMFLLRELRKRLF